MSDTISMNDKLATLTFHVDKNAHIVIDKKICSQCINRCCLHICPVDNYQWDEEGNSLIFNYEGCLECGTCRLICPLGAIQWSYPKRGSGVVYKFG